jgi:hypothetical protein
MRRSFQTFLKLSRVSARFPKGQVVLQRGVDERRRLIDVKPVTVVQDTENLVALWLPIGVPTKQPRLLTHDSGTPRRWEDGNWELIDSVWRWAELLILVRPHQLRATWVRWSESREFLGWAVNFQSELTRTHLGFDLTDYQLDILVEPDRSWQWKDEEEFQIAIETGRIPRELAEEIRKEAHRATEDIENSRWPFSSAFMDWKPDGLSPPTSLSSTWANLSMYQSAE